MYLVLQRVKALAQQLVLNGEGGAVHVVLVLVVVVPRRLVPHLGLRRPAPARQGVRSPGGEAAQRSGARARDVAWRDVT